MNLRGIILTLISIIVIYSSLVSAIEVPNDSPGLIAVYHFNSPNAFDSSQNGLNGTVDGPTYNASGGKFGGAYVFDGLNDGISIPHSSSFNFAGPFTVSAWVKINSNNNLERIVANWGLTGQQAFQLYYDSRTSKAFGFELNSNSKVNSTYTSTTDPNQWYHVAGVYDGSLQKLYLNGVLVNSKTNSGAAATTTQPIYIGRNTSGQFFSGTIDDVAIWNRALTVSEIQTLAASGSPSTPVCGNGSCESGETSSSCPSDCGAAVAACLDLVSDNKVNVLDLSFVGIRFGTTDSIADVDDSGTVDISDLLLVANDFGVCESTTVCGNAICESGETSTNCPFDCQTPAVCGNGSCESGETTSSCPSDCPATQVCGDGTCSGTENCSSCSTDCGACSPICGNLICESGENSSTCPVDCPSGPINLAPVITVSWGMDWYKNSCADPVDKRTYFKAKDDSYLGVTRGYAPFPVFFEGWESTPRDEIVDYEWEFNDPNSYSKNPDSAYGFNAAHVFEQPGTYITTLRVKNKFGIWSNRVSKTIEVLPRDGTQFWVDSAVGNDSNPGTQTSPWKTFDRVLDGIANNQFHPGDTVYFKRDQTFTVTKSIGNNGSAKAVLFTAEPGQGAKPIIQFTGTGEVSHFIRRIHYGIGHLAFADLVFKFQNPNGSGFCSSARCFAQGSGGVSEGLIGLYATATMNILLLRVEAYDSSNAVLLFSAGDQPQCNQTGGVFIVDSIVNDQSIYDYGDVKVFGDMARLAVLNSNFDLSGNHIFYLGMLDKGLFSGNIISRPAFGRTAIRITGNGDYPANNILISRNEITGWIDPRTTADWKTTSRTQPFSDGLRYNFMLLELGSNGETKHFTNNLVFERNAVKNFEKGLEIIDGENYIVRNNIFASPSTALDNASISVGSYRGWDWRPSKNITIAGNSILSASDLGIIVRDFPGSSEFPSSLNHENITIKNNIVKLLRSGASLKVESGQPLNQISSNNNILNGPSANVVNANSTAMTLAQWNALAGNDAFSSSSNPEFVSEFSDFHISSGSPAINAGALLPTLLYYDFDKSTRPKGIAQDIGAYEVQ